MLAVFWSTLQTRPHDRIRPIRPFFSSDFAQRARIAFLPLPCPAQGSVCLLGARCVETQILHATDVENDTLANIHKTQEYVPASRTTCHKTRSVHV